MKLLLSICCLLALISFSLTATSAPQTAQSTGMDAPELKPVEPMPAYAMTTAHNDGYANAYFGMTEQAFAKVWSGKLQHQSQVTPGCYYIYPKWAEHANKIDLAFMFVDGIFVRYDVGETALVAPGGGRIGMSLTQIHELYGARVLEGPRDYFNSNDPAEAKARSLRVSLPQSAAVLLFETDVHGNVEDWREGLMPAVDAMEGCS